MGVADQITGCIFKLPFCNNNPTYILKLFPKLQEYNTCYRNAGADTGNSSFQI